MSSTEVIHWTFISVEYKRPAFLWEIPPIIKTDVPVSRTAMGMTQFVETASTTDRSFFEYLDDKKSETLTDVGKGIADRATQSLGDVMKEFGLWLLQVLPDSFGILAMIFCLGAIASIPRTGKWACISLILAIIFEILRRLTL